MIKLRNIVVLASIALVSVSCATSGGGAPEDKRKVVQDMRTQVLTELYRIKPQTRSMIADSPGYGVFSNANVNIIFASFGGGYGVVKNNKSGSNTYMKMGEVGVGLGIGVKDFRAVFIFHDENTMKNFIDSGWQFGAQADAAAKSSDKGGAVGGEIVIDNITIYQITEAGLALQATVKGTKYWKDGELN
jgi:lipid-binding SYLF domain-containing protein